MPATIAKHPQSPGLSKDIANYLDDLANGLSQHFPHEDFNHLKLFGRLGVIARLYEHLIKSYLAPYDVMPIEHQVLVTLRSGIASEPAELAQATQQTRAGMTSTLDRIEKRKLIKRIPHPSDRRKRTIVLTKSGISLTDKLIKAQNQALSDTMESINKSQAKEINSVLDRLIQVMVTNP